VALQGGSTIQQKLPFVTLSRILLVALALALVGPWLTPRHGYGLSVHFLLRQDLWVAVLLFLAWSRIAAEPTVNAGQRLLPRWTESRYFLAAIVPLTLIGTCWAGRYVLYLDFDLSRDEQMANFDAFIFSHGRLFWAIPAFWRPFTDALNQTFILPLGHHEAWVSTYLPVNAAIRALFGMIADPALLNPVLAGTAFVALWRLSLRLMPHAPNARAVTLILFICSSQMLITAMTSYAMTAHLAFNLIWLLLFLKDRSLTHAAAMAIGFLATGLHQPLFHPLFVAPFLFLLVGQRRWRLLALYCGAYVAITLFWLLWPIWVASHASTYVAVQGNEATSYTDRLAIVLSKLDISSAYLMILNLVRFAAWQHVLLIPLAVTNVLVSWRSDPLTRALAVAFFLPIVAMSILLAYQGHGWGYRYVHGVLGNACLLAGLGWMHFENSGVLLRKTLALTTAMTGLLVMPFQAWAVHRHVKAYADVDRLIGSSQADIAVIDETAAPFAQDLVQNKPDLSNHPIRISYNAVRTGDISRLCARGTTMLLVGRASFTPVRNYFRQNKEDRASDRPSSQQLECFKGGSNAASSHSLGEPNRR